MQRIGILGGSFDPPHRAHIALAERASRALSLTRLLVIPAGDPWQKHHLTTDKAARLAMLELAFAHCEAPISIDTRELERAGPSYSAETLRQLRAEWGQNAILFFLIGSDQLYGLPSWHEWPSFLELAHFVVIERPDAPVDVAAWPAALRAVVPEAETDLSRLGPAGGAIAVLPGQIGDISSTQVRELLRHGNDEAADLVPSSVLKYIRENGLYRA